MTNYKIIDADGHVRESIAGLREFLEPRWQRRNLFPNDAWDRDLHGKLGANPARRGHPRCSSVTVAVGSGDARRAAARRAAKSRKK